jgi:hypothetical protein
MTDGLETFQKSACIECWPPLDREPPVTLSRRRYPTDMTDAKWQPLAPHQDHRMGAAWLRRRQEVSSPKRHLLVDTLGLICEVQVIPPVWATGATPPGVVSQLRWKGRTSVGSRTSYQISEPGGLLLHPLGR